ncbi:MAG: hypothetical protein OEV91_01365 [Desulfobulbaceae bacterium]|nr:hypothetical protein [Desulfobulbaceae bacterium]
MAPTQLDLFKQPAIGAVVRDMKAAMNDAVKSSRYSREQVLDRMNELAKRHGVKLNKAANELTQATFEKWLNVNEVTHYPNPVALAIFCAACESTLPVGVLAAPAGGMVIDGEDIKLLLWARAYHRAKGLRKKMRELEAEL